MLQFGEHGRENLRNLKRDDFAVTRDGEGKLSSNLSRGLLDIFIEIHGSDT
jgi:hypothetical protein